LRGLFRAVGVDGHQAEILTDIVADWRDPTDAKRLNGASRDDYRLAGFAYGPRKAPFSEPISPM
jgi:type II secretory pathway component PulK